MGEGYLKIDLFLGEQALPVQNVRAIIKDVNGNTLYTISSDESGVTDKVAIQAPDKRLSEYPNNDGPCFSVVDVEIPMTNTNKRCIIHDVQIFDGETSILPVLIHPLISDATDAENTDEIFIPIKHGVDLTNRPTAQTEPDGYGSLGRIEQMQLPMASQVQIPEYITVHLGSPNAAAANVRVKFSDYIKNVASSEIFPTWEESALYANIYCQISFALNRVFTVWYRSRGFDFDITNNTAFDQYFVNGRNIFENISRIVDRIFNNFIKREGRAEPFFASYCNGTTSQCDGLSQWGSQELALKGYTPIQILKYYFPNDIGIYESNNFTADIGTYGGVPLREGSRGEAVRTMQRYLNRISGNFYIPAVGFPDGVFGTATKNSVMAFQRINNLIPDGIIGKSTWYAITKVYVAVKELAELTSEGERIHLGTTPPSSTIQLGARGELVVELQFILNFISEFFPTVPFVIQSGVFTDDTKRGVVEFQKGFGLTPDGIVGPATWRELYDIYWSIFNNVDLPPAGDIPPFPGVALRLGSQGEDVRIMQTYLNAIAKRYSSIPTIAADGYFGSATQAAVIAFQRQFGLTPDGIIGQETWYAIVEAYGSLPPIGGLPEFPGTPLTIGSRGDNVRFMQNNLNDIGKVFPSIPHLSADGIFGALTASAVEAFQRLFGLTADGIIGRNTWDKIISVYSNLPAVAAPVYPGTALRVGSRGNDVIIMQKYLNALSAAYPSIPAITADGIFGPRTEQAVTAFQRQFGLTADGVIGRNTWNEIVSRYNLMNMGAVSANSLQGLPARVQSGGPTREMAMLIALMMMGR